MIKAPLRIPLGSVLLDDTGHAWVYYGYRILTTGSKMLMFVRERDYKHPALTPDWKFSAASVEALSRKFPGIDRFKI